MTDLLNCLDVKIPIVDDCEARVHVLWKARADALVVRRELDYADAYHAMTSDPRKRKIASEANEDADRQRRMLNKRHRREKRVTHAAHPAAQHGTSEATDDDESSADVEKRRFNQSQIVHQSKEILSDVVEDFAGVKNIADKFQDWKFNFEKSYNETFAGDSLRKILTPLVKLQLLQWNPMDNDCVDISEMMWFQDLEEYGLRQDEEADDNDPDQLKLVQDVVEQAVIPKLTGITEHVWDPLSTTQSKRLQEEIRALLENFGHAVTTAREATQVLFTKIVKRLRRLVKEFADFTAFPALSVEQAGSAFVQQTIVDELKVVKAVMGWEGLIKLSTLQEIVFEHLMNRIVGTLRCLPAPMKLDHAEQIIRVLPQTWFHGTTASAKKKAAEAQLAVMPLVDEVLNVKVSLAQSRTCTPAISQRVDAVVAALGTSQ